MIAVCGGTITLPEFDLCLAKEHPRGACTLDNMMRLVA